jgi:hypothetical protein
MEEELISKKDLLELTNISYGQLYRWKRKGLIPEEWFIKKSSFTGQETYFPRLKVLSRIEKIKNMKEDVSLDDLADVFTPTLSKLSVQQEEIIARGIAVPHVLKLYADITGETGQLEFSDILSIYLLNRFIVSGELGLDEGRLLLETLKEASVKTGLESGQVYMVRKLGVFSCFIVSPAGEICFDKGVKLVNHVHLAALIEELKLKLM